MAEDINFLPEQSTEDKEKLARQKKTNFFSILALLVMMGVLIALSGYWLFLTLATRTVESIADQKEVEIQSEAEKEVVRRALVDKLNTSENILTTTTPFSVALTKITDILNPKNIPLNDSTLTVDKDLVFSMNIANAVDFQAVVDALTGSDLSTTFGKAKLSTFKKEKAEGPYLFQVDVTFLSKGVSELPSK